MTDTRYTSVEQYLDALKKALAGAPKSLIADALADCEEHLRGAVAAHPDKTEAEVFAEMAKSYGSPEEVAAEYRAMDLPPAGPFARSEETQETPYFSLAADAPDRWTLTNVFTDMRTYGALIYMLLSLATGVFYFTWATVGTSLSAGLFVLIVGIPFFVLFVASVRLLSHVEGRIVEALLGVRMPRRMPAQIAAGFWDKLKTAFTDLRTWSSLAYMFLMLPLGIAYFVIAVVGLALSGGLVVGGLASIVDPSHIHVDGGPDWVIGMAHSSFTGVLAAVIGVVVFFGLMHLARLIGWLHGRVAEHLLVRL